MRRLVVLLMIILLAPAVMAQTLDYNFFLENGDLLSVNSGLLYLSIPNSTLEKSNIVAGAMFFPKTGFNGDLTLSVDGVELDKDFYALDDAPGNESYLIFEWPIYATQSLDLDFAIKSDNQIEYENNFSLNVKARDLLDRNVVEKTIPLTIEIPENSFEIREKLSEQGIDISEDEFALMIENAKTTKITKETEKEVLTYEGNLIITKSKTTFKLDNAKNNEIYIIENIDKSVAQDASLIHFSVEPTILENDPLIMWHIEDSNTDELSYEIEKEGLVDEDLTGNTILLVGAINEQDKTDLKKILMPLILIPLVVLIIIYFGTINTRKKK
ncbi:hypothetical protein JXA48_01450 [Candidatus Woesearchaeota archaeon]|nr:hypothetical protein [Candidatus Woesearchaeota archaeon]